MTIFLCKTCGTSYPDSSQPPAHCPICEDERQYIPASGQEWLPRGDLARGHRNAWHRHEPGLFSLQTVPAFAINQRAFLVQTPMGNVLWDCIALLDKATEQLIHALGGVAAIAISHPHYYTTMQDWAAAFRAPIHLHASDRHWIMRPDAAVKLWDGDSKELWPGVMLVRGGGHFAGGTVLHWADGAEGRGALLAGDILQVTPGAHRVSFMWSYPNMMPLPAGEVRHLVERVSAWPFERIYGAFLGQDVLADGHAVISRSAARYIELLEGKGGF